MQRAAHLALEGGVDDLMLLHPRLALERGRNHCRGIVIAVAAQVLALACAGEADEAVDDLLRSCAAGTIGVNGVLTTKSELDAKLGESRGLILAVSQLGITGIIVVSPAFFALCYDERYAEAAVFAPLLAVSGWIIESCNCRRDTARNRVLEACTAACARATITTTTIRPGNCLSSP